MLRKVSPVLLLFVSIFVANRGGADNLCKPAAPLSQAKCTKDAQCCAGLVCQGGLCQSGCRIAGTFYPAGTVNPAKGCQFCQPAVTTTAWTNRANGTACNDGNACTQTDTCQNGTCTGSNPVVCTALDQCHVAGTCNTTTGQCSNPNATNGTACNDGNACTQTDTCQSGSCVGSNPVSCTASDQCHIAGTCDPSTGACSTPAAADGTACNPNANGAACTSCGLTFSRYPGADGILNTGDDHILNCCDFQFEACGNPCMMCPPEKLAITEQFATLGVHFANAADSNAPGAGIEEIGSNFPQDPVDSSNNPILVNFSSGTPLFPLSVRFDTPQTDVAFDYAGFIECGPSSETITVTDQTGGTHTKPLASFGHFDVTAAADSGGQSFVGIDFPLTSCPEGGSGGFGLDNLTFNSGVCQAGGCQCACQPRPATTTTTTLPSACSEVFTPCGTCGNGLCVVHCGGDGCAGTGNACINLSGLDTTNPCSSDGDCPAGEYCGAAPEGCGVPGQSGCAPPCP